MGAIRLSHIARRTIDIDLGFLVSVFTGLVRLLIFNGRSSVRVHVPPPSPSVAPPGPTPTPTLRIPKGLTLHLRSPWDSDYVKHNCVQAHCASARMAVATQNVHEPYSSVRESELFEPFWFLPLNRTSGTGRYSEKLNFTVNTVHAHWKLIYLDSEVILISPNFFRGLAVRPKATNLLAIYVHDAPCAPSYYGFFNSGVMFISAVDKALLCPLKMMEIEFWENGSFHFVARAKFQYMALRWRLWKG